MRVNVFETDVLVIGGGLAAARAAIAAADAGVEVAIVSKAPLGKSGASAMAGGAIAAALAFGGQADSPDAHYRDMLSVGRGLADPELARFNVEEAPARVRDLMDFGVNFRMKDGRLYQDAVPGHSHRRLLHTAGGGVDYMNPLRRKINGYANVHLCEDTMAVRMFRDGSRAAGALCLDIRRGELSAFAAGATILATGGYQDLYPLSSASCDVTGDGFALAFEAGAELVDMEILLFYPTALLNPASLRGTLILYEYFLQSRHGAGARLVNIDGEDLLEQYDTLPVRDELSRRIFDEVRRGKGSERKGLFVDVSRSSVALTERTEVLKQLGPVYGLLTSVGFNVAESKFEVGPAAHTVLGGIRINARCETTVPGLYAAGEVAGNVHGANRLGGNALTDTQVFGFRSGLFAAEFAKEIGRPDVSDNQVADAAQVVLRATTQKDDPTDATEVKDAIRQTMYEHVGLLRSEESLATALQTIDSILRDSVPRIQAPTEPTAYNYPLVEALEADLMARTAALVCRAARLRRESRGHHYRSDYPTPDNTKAPQRTCIYQTDGELGEELYPAS